MRLDGHEAVLGAEHRDRRLGASHARREAVKFVELKRV